MGRTYENKEVRFDIYCRKCIHFDKLEGEDPCFDCLDEPVNVYSRKPIRFVEDETKGDKTNGNKK